MCIVVWVDGISSIKLRRSADVVASGEREARTSGNDTKKHQAPEERDKMQFRPFQGSIFFQTLPEVRFAHHWLPHYRGFAAKIANPE
jgi:hypothetical protein